MAIPETYKAWVRQNHEHLASLETVLNTFTWLLPERYTSSEIVPEAVAAILGLVTTLNQHILSTDPQIRGHHLAGNSLRSDLERRCLPLSSLLTAVKQVEVLIEVAAEYYKGKDNKWNILAAVEAIKACLRFAILHKNKYQMLLDGQTAVIPTKKSINQRQSAHGSKAIMAMSKFGVNTKPSWTNRQQNLESTISHRTVLEESVSKKKWELHDELSAAGEWMYILRPLIYVLLIRRYGLMSWKPWICSFALETSSIATILAAEKYNLQSNNYQQLSKEEIQEIRRRQCLLLLYLARDPFFSMYTRPCLETTTKILRPVPFIGGKLMEILSGIQSRYFYTSGS